MKFLMPFLIASIAASAALGQSSVTLNDFAFMAGCWELRDESKKLLVSEQWMSPAGTSIIGMGRTVRDGKTTDWEFMRIEQRSDGIYFVAKPKANTEETAFKMIGSAAGEFIFENKAHDFPQRVIYNQKRANLAGRIEGSQNGKFLGIDFPMERVKCRP